MLVPEKETGLSPGYRAGKFRAYFSTKIAPLVFAKTQLTALDYKFAVVVFAVAAISRTFKLHSPPKVVFDETHFGHFVQQYFHGDFFVDVHPPLVKLVFYGIASVFRWDGQFPFKKIGDTYDASVPYVAMRFFSAFCGVVTAIVTYFTLRASGCRARVATIGSFFVVFENSLATQSRVIMLDSGLVAFSALAVFLFQKSQIAEPFSRKWYKTLLATGAALGLAVSTKLTGIFTILWVLVCSAVQISSYLGDLEVTATQVVLHIVTRFLAYVVVPATIYCGFFSLHFMMLPYASTGAAVMSPSFKAGLSGAEKMRNIPVDVSYGSTVTIRHHRLDKYLHSHDFPYKTGTREQQVSMYGFDPDLNNKWVLETYGENYDGKLDMKFRPIKDGDTVKLFHKNTQKYLRANDVRPPNSEHDYSKEVLCAGNQTDTANSDYEWRVKIIGRKPHAENELPFRKLRATESVFQLTHHGLLCQLLSHDVQLPDWGFHQNQVLCMTGPTLANTLWYIESNSHPVLDADPILYPRVKFTALLLFRKLVEYHHAMWMANRSFVQEHVYASLPYAWPVVLRGINYYSNGHGHENVTDKRGSHIYLLGNVVVYYTGLLAIVCVFVSCAFYALHAMNPFRRETQFCVQDSASFLKLVQYASGWALHFAPYLFMERQLFAHHYLPCVFFLVLTVSQFIEIKVNKNTNSGSELWAGFWLRAFEACLCGVVFVFVKFSPLIYGTEWTVKQCQHAKWLPGWDFDCMAYSQ